MTIREKQRIVPRDRYAELLVAIVVAIALVVAWGVKAGAESRAVHIETAGLKASYGHNWIRDEPIPPQVLKIVDPESGARFRTTITVESIESAGSGEDVARALNQERLLEQNTYRPLRSENVQLRQRDVVRNEFAYVYVSPDLLNPTVPVVVHGVDYILPQGNTTYVITCVADERVYDQAMVEFGRFLDSISPG